MIEVILKHLYGIQQPAEWSTLLDRENDIKTAFDQQIKVFKAVDKVRLSHSPQHNLTLTAHDAVSNFQCRHRVHDR